MIDFNKLNLTEGMDPIEQSASDKAVESGQQKKDPSRITRQKSQMAQQSQMKTKSNVVYASEAIDRLKAYNRQKSDWRIELEEEKEVDPEHPYVDVMPMTNGNEKRAKEQMKLAKKVGLTNAKTAIATGMTNEEVDFDEMFGDLVERELSIDQQMKMAREAGKKRNPKPDHRAIRARQMANSKAPKDTRTDSQKMADATDERPGSFYRNAKR